VQSIVELRLLKAIRAWSIPSFRTCRRRSCIGCPLIAEAAY
jgi:hypothetical protein